MKIKEAWTIVQSNDCGMDIEPLPTEVQNAISEVAREILTISAADFRWLSCAMRRNVVKQSLQYFSYDQLVPYLDTEVCSSLVNESDADQHLEATLWNTFVHFDREKAELSFAGAALTTAHIEEVFKDIPEEIKASAKHLMINKSRAMTALPDLAPFSALESLTISGCNAFNSLQTLNGPHLLAIELMDLHHLSDLSGIERATTLQRVVLKNCDVRSLEPVTLLPNLKEIEISACYRLFSRERGDTDFVASLEKLPEDLEVLKTSDLPGWRDKKCLERFTKLQQPRS